MIDSSILSNISLNFLFVFPWATIPRIILGMWRALILGNMQTIAQPGIKLTRYDIFEVSSKDAYMQQLIEHIEHIVITIELYLKFPNYTDPTIKKAD